MPNLFAAPGRLPLIAPSILSADFAAMGADCRSILNAGADLLHVDVMDGHFAPNLTMGHDMVRDLRRTLPNAFLDCHLMVTDPGRYIEPFAKAGASHFTFHVEVIHGAAVAEMVKRIRGLGMSAGLAINPPTPVETILPYVEGVDLVLVMSVNPGFSGQSFIASVLDKTRAIRARLRPDQRLEMDGGINLQTARAVHEAGCDVFVAGSSVFGVPQDRRASVIQELRGR